MYNFYNLFANIAYSVDCQLPKINISYNRKEGVYMPKLLHGYKYTTMDVIRYGDFHDLKKLARRENRRLKRGKFIGRYAVYPVPGSMIGVGQLVFLT